MTGYIPATYGHRKGIFQLKRVLTGIAAASIVLGSAMPFAMASTDNSLASWFKLNVTVGGQAFSAPEAFTQGNETYLPVFYVDEALKKLGYTVSWDGAIHRWNLTTPAQVDATSAFTAWGNNTGSGATSVALNGMALAQMNTMVQTDPATNMKTVYAPASFLQPLLKALGAGTWTASGYNLDLGAATSISSAVATNGSVKVTFSQPLTAAPSASDFVVTGTVGTTSSAVTVSDVKMSTDMTTATLTIPEIAPTSGQPVPHYSVSYQGQTAVTGYERVVAVNDGTIGETSKTLSVGQTLTAAGVSDQCTPMPTITFQSDNTAVATVTADGTVTAIAPGVAHITATDAKGFTADVPLTVTVQ